MQPYPPLQTLLAAACLRRAGFSVALFDSTLEAPQPGFELALERHRPRLVAVIEDNFNYLTKMCLTRNREVAHWMARVCGVAGIPAVVNGADASDRASEYRTAGFQYVIRGEVEQAIVDIAQGSDPPRTPPAELDSLPMPAWDLIDAAPYRDAWQQAHGYFSLNLVSSRGCPYRCNWCAKPIWGDSYRSRSARLVAEELREVKRRFAPAHIWFADDIFALSQQWTHEFAEAVEELDAKIPFKMQSRCDLMTRETVADLRRAGCDEVWMGVESGSQKILDSMDKGSRIWQVFESRENLRRHDIRAGFFLQFGYPGETWTEIEKTIELVRDTQPDDIGVSVSYPLPGTKFHQMVSDQFGAKENWSDSDDLDMMYQGAFSTGLYRALADALHLEVRQGRDAAASAWSNVLALRETCARKMPLWISC
jgi:anaerobic magnesium-protoporphyrin IX monomethyl ester cyclase